MTQEVELSKAVSQALRHAAAEYGLRMDEDGWVALSDLAEVLARRDARWRDLTPARLESVLAEAGKGRHEIRGDRIRALYGHSAHQPVVLHTEPPPDILYHGTDPQAVPSILAQGLKAMGRQGVHLSESVEAAQRVGRRKSGSPTILRIAARQAHQSGIRFSRRGASVWLADHVPPAFVTANG